jgi:hypothetical protein
MSTPKDNDDMAQPLPRVYLRPQIEEKINKIREFIDEQRGNDLTDQVGLRIQQEIIHDLYYIRRWAWTGKQVPTMNRFYRQKRTGGGTYLLYYYIDEERNTIIFLDLRHGRQRSPAPSTLRKYKAQTQTE